METLRLILRDFETDDFQDFSELICDRQASEYSIYDEPFPTDDENLKKILLSFVESDQSWAIELKAEHRIIGFVRLCDVDDSTKRLEYCIHTDYQGNEYAKEAILEIIRYAKYELKLIKLISDTAKENTPSVQLLNHAGFSLVGENPGTREDSTGGQIKFTTYSFECALL